MPFLKVHQVNKSKIWGIWELTESVEEMLSKLDTSLENGEYLLITHPKKVNEWAGSRVIAMELMKRLNQDYKGIRKDEFGKPWLKEVEGFISISHKYPFVIVIIDLESEVGIDIEPVNKKIMKLAHKFLDDEERKWAHNSNWVTLVWASKEALYKWHGRKSLIFKDQLKVSRTLEEGKLIGKIIEEGNIIEHRLNYEYCLEDVLLVYTD